MATGSGWVWHDFEDTCSGPVAWDLAASTASQRLDGRRVLAAYGEPVDAAQLAALRAAQAAAPDRLVQPVRRTPAASAPPGRRTPRPVAAALTCHAGPGYVVSGGMNDALAPLRDTKTILLTTYKKDGTPVATPVSIAFDGERAFFRSYDKAWKTKRLSRNPAVQAAPATTLRGQPPAPPSAPAPSCWTAPRPASPPGP